jgi:hypothetical protein
MSPQGVYNQSSNPPESWAAAPVPSQIQVVAGSGGDPDRIILRWADNDIKNRWLRVTIKSTEDTGLFNDEIFYAGHLLGETTGASSGIYTVATPDLSAISAAVGQSATVDSILDIDKNGTISFADISAARANLSTQQENITTTSNPLADLTRSQSWDLDTLGNFESLTNNDGSAVTRTVRYNYRLASLRRWAGGLWSWQPERVTPPCGSCGLYPSESSPNRPEANLPDP